MSHLKGPWVGGWVGGWVRWEGGKGGQVGGGWVEGGKMAFNYIV